MDTFGENLRQDEDREAKQVVVLGYRGAEPNAPGELNGFKGMLAVAVLVGILVGMFMFGGVTGLVWTALMIAGRCLGSRRRG